MIPAPPTVNANQSFQQGQSHPLSALCLHQLIQQHAIDNPNKVAVVHDDDVLTYHDLDEQANTLAHFLIQQGVKPGHLVGLHTDRAIGMIVAILAILKTGAAYLPLDPEHDLERVTRIVKDARPRIVLTNIDYARWPACFRDCNVFDLRTLTLPSGQLGDPGIEVPNTSNFYAVFTSGTTGTPKGVQLTHRNMVNLVTANLRDGGMDFSVVLQFSVIGFDASANEIFSTLIYGGKLVMIDAADRLAPSRMFDVVEKHQVKTLLLNAMYVQKIFSKPEFVALIPDCVSDIQSTGQRLIVSDALRKFSLKGCRVWNEMGPAEAHVVLSGIVDVTDPYNDTPSVGHPIYNTGIAIVNPGVKSGGKPKLVGNCKSGEIYICGDSVGPGYYGNDELTNERFVHLNLDGQTRRFYKTGDIGRFNSDGSVDYLGRIDDQMKVLGMPTNPGEIEAGLLRIPGIIEAAVIRKPGEKQDTPIAFLVTSDPNLNEQSIREQLHIHQKLHPQKFYFLDKMPVNPHGKRDEESLRQTAINGSVKRRILKRKLGETEKTVAKLVGDIIEETVIPHDVTIKDLGGDSLFAMELIDAFRKKLDIGLELQQAQGATIEELALLVDGRGAESQQFDLDEEGCLTAYFLTGATGFVGSQLAYELLTTTNADLFCLVRAKSKTQATANLIDAMKVRGIWKEEFARRLHAVPGDVTSDTLGMSRQHYEWLASRVERIYHAAADVNFNQPFKSSRRTNVGGVKNIVRFAQAAIGTPIPIHHFSSFSAADVVDSSLVKRIPEESINELPLHGQASSAYAMGKWCGERTLMDAKKEGVSVTIYRLPRMTRRVGGPSVTDLHSHNLQDLMFIFLKASMQIGCIPNIDIRDVWLPVDHACKLIVQLSGSDHFVGDIFNLSHLSPVTRSEILDEAADDLDVVPMDEWLSKLKANTRASETCRTLLMVQKAMQAEFAGKEMSCERTEQAMKELGIEWQATSRDLVAEYFRDWRNDPSFKLFNNP